MKIKKGGMILFPALMAALISLAQPARAQKKDYYLLDLFGGFALLSEDVTQCGWDAALTYNLSSGIGIVLDVARYRRHITGEPSYWNSVIVAGGRFWTEASPKVLGYLEILAGGGSSGVFVLQPGFGVDWRPWINFALRTGLDVKLARDKSGRGTTGIRVVVGLAYFFIKR
jgi:hypothetical protein